MQNKTCTKCGVIKSIEEFSNKGGSIYNFSSIGESINWDPKKNTCKDCDAAYAREFRKINPGYRGSGKNKKYPKEYRLLLSAIRTRLNTCCSNFRRRNNGICDSDLDDDYLFDLFQKQKGLCVYTGIPLKIIKAHPASLSLDKIEPNKGYIKGNVQWVCWAVNRAKGDLTESEFLKMCKVITTRCNDYPVKE